MRLPRGDPGRLIDRFQTSNLAPRCASLKVLVLDEADQLLEMGFKPSIDKILGFIPRDRQTLLFSATVPKQVQSIAANALRPGYAYVDCVGEDDSATNLQVQQWLTIAPLDDHLPLLVQLIASHQAQVPDHKVICFFPTARATQLAAELFVALGKPVSEIHSRKSQGHRTKAADQFRDAVSTVMMSSDVSARGMDFPNVTMVIQVGLPSSKEQYIHRLGRTARAGKSGEGLLLLAPHEEFFARQLRDLPITNAPAAVDPNTAHTVAQALARVDVRTKEQAYVAWMGFYNGSCGKMGWSKTQLVEHASRYALEVLGCPGLPGVLKKTVGMMGLKGVPGLNIQSELPGGRGGGGGSGRQGRRRRAQAPLSGAGRREDRFFFYIGESTFNVGVYLFGDGRLRRRHGFHRAPFLEVAADGYPRLLDVPYRAQRRLGAPQPRRQTVYALHHGAPRVVLRRGRRLDAAQRHVHHVRGLFLRGVGERGAAADAQVVRRTRPEPLFVEEHQEHAGGREHQAVHLDVQRGRRGDECAARRELGGDLGLVLRSRVGGMRGVEHGGVVRRRGLGYVRNPGGSAAVNSAHASAAASRRASPLRTGDGGAQQTHGDGAS